MWVSFFFAHDFRWFAAACGRFSVDGRCFMVEPMPADHSRRARRGGNRAQLWAVKIWSWMSHSLTVCVCIYNILCIYAYIVVYILYIINNNIIYAYHIYITILKSVEFMPPAFSNWAPEPAFRQSANPMAEPAISRAPRHRKIIGFHKSQATIDAWLFINLCKLS